MTWKYIKNTNRRYSVSSAGLIRCNRTGDILKGSWTGKTKERNRKPYKCHGLVINGARVFNLTHRIVATHFIPNPENLPQVNHINENVQDNRVENLEWTTNKANCRHSYKRKILQKDLDGNIVCEWEGLYEIRDNGYSGSAVCQVLSPKYNTKTHKGYRWEYGL